MALYNFLYYLSMYGNRATADETGDVRGDNEASRPYPGYPSQKFIENEDIFLVIGSAIPEGKTVYVLIRKRGRDSKRLEGAQEFSPHSFLLINPCNGNIYRYIIGNWYMLVIYRVVREIQIVQSWILLASSRPIIFGQIFRLRPSRESLYLTS